MEPKKISFGFKKIQRASDSKLPTVNKASEERKDYIECVEENAIKVVGGEIIEERAPLVIPMKQNTLTAERFKQIAAEVESVLEEPSEPKEEIKEYVKIENETLEQQAARELLEEAKNVKNDIQEQALTLPVIAQPLSGQKESTLEEYESVPITEYGMAMLRGMGWTAGEASKYVQPILRPKGLGLGADKLVKQTTKIKKHNSESVEELKLVKGCYVKILAGKYSSAYGKVVSLNDENARAVVELALGKEQVTVGEQLLQPVTKAVYDECSKVINSEKYDEYKKKELANANSSTTQEKYSDQRRRNEKYRQHSSSEEDKQHNKGNSRKQSPSKEYERSKDINKYSESRSNGKSSRDNVKHRSCRDSRTPSPETRRTERRDKSSRSESRKVRHSSGSSEENSKLKYKQKERRSSDSLEDSSDEYRKRSKKKKDSTGKRDIDKKRKGKKKKRDRDRSPHSRKHKK